MAGDALLVGKHLEKSLIILERVTKILDKYSIGYVLNFGTLLGIVRENRLLPWDSDIDITIEEKDVEKFRRSKKYIRKAGYRTRIRYFDKDVGPFKKGDVRIIKIKTRRLFIMSKTIMDVFVVKNTGEECQYMVKKKDKFMLKSYPAKFQTEKIKLLFNNSEYYAPKDYVGMLEYAYGDWKTPVKDWDFFAGDGCAKEIY
jgi:phosphorylcholine metabolism protein LicD